MKILVIGASKFIGSHLIDRLLKNNYSEKVYCTFFSNNYSNQYNDNKLVFQKCDVRDFDNLKLNVLNSDADIIVYMASTRYYPAPLNLSDHQRINVNGIKNLIKICDEMKKVPRIIFINSGASNLNLNKNEKVDNYISSKQKASELFKLSNNINGSQVNLYTPYGPRDYKYRLIQSTVIDLLNNKNPILNNPNSLRDFIYIDDVIDVLEKVILNKNNIESLDIGNSSPVSTLKIMEEIYKVMNINKPIYINQSKGIEDITYMKADLNNANELLNWSPKINLEKGIYNTVEWTKKNYKNYYE
tara:strand:- start:215 stop:1117 length:903 start_codon:yes stop_codon:yes gene_type:complete